jgi:hypothetical protein
VNILSVQQGKRSATLIAWPSKAKRGTSIMPEAQCVRYPIKARATRGIGRLGRSDHSDYILIYASAEDLPATNEALSSSQLPLVLEFDQLIARLWAWKEQ